MQEIGHCPFIYEYSRHAQTYLRGWSANFWCLALVFYASPTELRDGGLEKQMKPCSNCHKTKSEAEFRSREDAWGLYAWCNSCRIKEGRTRISKEMEAYMEKTRLFVVGEMGDGAENSISHPHPHSNIRKNNVRPM